MTNAQNHFGIHTHIVKQPFYIHPPPPQKMSEKQLNLQLLKKEENGRLPTLFPVSWNTVESACLHLHTNVTFYLPRGWGRFYSLHRDALDKPFFPRMGDKLVMHSEKVRGNSMHFASGAFSPSSFSFMRHCYAVICVSRLEYIGFVSISLKDEAACCLKRLPKL